MSTARKSRRFFVILLPAIACFAAGQPSAEQARERRLQWWREARFGMFIHWGLYALPAYRDALIASL